MATTTDERGLLGMQTATLTGLHWLGIGLAAVTGVIHLVLGTNFLPSRLGISFLLAGGGFFGAIVLVLYGVRRRLLYVVGIPYTAVQLVAWYYLNFVAGGKQFPADVGTLGAIDKLAQVAFMGVLIVLLRRA